MQRPIPTVPTESPLPTGFDVQQWKMNRARALTAGGRYARPRPFEKIARVLRRFAWARGITIRWHNLFSRDRLTFDSRSLFPTLDAKHIAEALKRDGFHPGILLPASIRKEILDYVEANRCQAGFGGPCLDQLSYHHQNVGQVEKMVGEKINISHYPNIESSCPAVSKLIRDPKLAEVVEGFIGCKPLKYRTMLWWSHVTDMTTEERRQSSQTVDFHFDELDPDPHRRGNLKCPVLYVNFYLTDVDSEAGPHILVSASHRRKPLAYYFQPASKSEKDMVDTYGAQALIEITGPAGTIFFEDPFIFHRATPPVSKPRLFLQIRYFV